MIELLLKLIDRIIDLRKYQAARLKNSIDSDLEPLFKDLLAVHSNYLRMFQDTLAQVLAIEDFSSEGGKQRLAEIAEHLRQQRIELEPVRVKIVAAGNVMANPASPINSQWSCREAEQFVRDAIDYLPRGSLGDGKSRSTTILKLLYGASRVIPSEMQQHGSGFASLIQATIDDCREKWEKVCASYALLKRVVREAQ